MTVQPEGAIVPRWTFGDRIRKARSLAGMDQRNFAEAIGAKPSSIAAWETDRATPRDIVEVARRVEYLTHIPAQWTLGLTDGGGPGGGVSTKATVRSLLPWLDSNQQSSDCATVTKLPARRRGRGIKQAA